MAQQTRVRAVLLTKADCHIGVRDIVNLVRAYALEHAVHYARHVAGNTTACLALEGVMGVRRSLRFVLKLGVATGAHPIRFVFEFERSWVG